MLSVYAAAMLCVGVRVCVWTGEGSHMRSVYAAAMVSVSRNRKCVKTIFYYVFCVFATLNVQKPLLFITLYAFRSRTWSAG